MVEINEAKSARKVTKAENPKLKCIRRLIVLIVFAYTAIFGLPLWFGTTRIYRASLPVTKINELVSNLPNEIHMEIPVHVQPGGLPFSLEKAQSLIDYKMRSRFSHLDNMWGIRLATKGGQDQTESLSVKFNKTINGDDTENIITYNNRELIINYTNQDKIEDVLANTLIKQIFAQEIDEFTKIFNPYFFNNKDVDVVLPYSSKYNIVFSLFTESGEPIEWEIEKMTSLLEPIFNKLQPFAKFSVSSQVQYYSTLDIQPVLDATGKNYIVEEKDLSTFINFGDWNLFSHELTPTVNFVTFFAKSNYENKPLKITQSQSNSFLVPQWGGVYFFNKDLPILEGSRVSITESEMNPIMNVFVSQLYKLIGLNADSKSIDIKFGMLARITATKNLKKALENLVSLVKLTQSLSGISIPHSTQEYINRSLENAKDAIDLLNQGEFYRAIASSALSLENSDKAFFEKEMVQQAYFPSEHMLAVYLPLLGPVLSIILLATLRTVKELRSKNKEKTA